MHLNRESSSSFNYFHHRNAHFLLHLRPLKTHLPIKPTKLKSQLKTTKIGAFLQRFSILILNYNETIISYLFLYVRTYWRRPMCIFLFGDENPPQTLINPPIQPTYPTHLKLWTTHFKNLLESNFSKAENFSNFHNVNKQGFSTQARSIKQVSE